MMRAGKFRPLADGIYSFLSLGYKMVKEFCDIIWREMDAIGGQEFHLPALNPKDLCEKNKSSRSFRLYFILNKNSGLCYPSNL